MITDRGLSVNAETDDTKKSTKKQKNKKTKKRKNLSLKTFQKKEAPILKNKG